MEVVNNYEHTSSSAEVEDEGRKRKISNQVITTDDDIDDIDDIDDYVDEELEVEIVELGSSHSKLQSQYLSQPTEEREDDRIESLSDIYCSSPPSSPIHNQEDQGTSTPSVRAHGQTHKQQDSALPTTPPQPETERTAAIFPILARITHPPSRKRTPPSSPSSLSSSSATTDNPSPGKSVPDQASRSGAESAASSGSHSLTERGTKPSSFTAPIPRFKGVGSSGPSAGIFISTPPRSTDSGANGEEDGHRLPTLSPGAKERLVQFDRAVMQIELEKGKEKEQRLEDGAILGKGKKSGEKEWEEEKDREMVVTGGTQTKDKPGVSPSQPLEIAKRREPLFPSDEPGSNPHSHACLKSQLHAKNQNGKLGSKETGKEQLNKRLPPHHPSDSSRLANREEAEEDNSFSTDIGSTDTKLTDRKTFNAFSETVFKSTSNPQSTNTARASPPPSTTAVRRSRSKSFVRDIISETEESRSQSQETDMQVPTVSHSLVPPTIPPSVNINFALKSRMNSKTPQPKPRSLSKTSSAVEMLAHGVQLGIEMDVGNDAAEKLNGEMDDVDETGKETSHKIPDLAIAMESSGPISRISSRTSKSRSRSRSVSSQKSKNVKEPVSAEDETPLTVSIHQESLEASHPADSQINFTHNIPTFLNSSSFSGQRENSPHLGAAMHLLNTKSEEISKLENQLSAERRTNEDLLQQLSALRRHIAESTNDTPSATMTLEHELAEARAQLALQTVSWENERATLTRHVASAIQSKESAEQDRDFFRGQYHIASGFVSSVRDENAELEKQIKIAIDQAHSGVSLIKTTFELRTKTLEEDARAWRKVAEFLIEKDHRTNDEIRRRAGEEPELRARCDRQESALEDFSERLLQTEMDLDGKERLFVLAEEARKGLQETTVKLSLDLNEAEAKLKTIVKVGIGSEILKSTPPTPPGLFPYR